MVWGHTFQTTDKTRNMIGEVPAEYDALIERLNEQLPDRLQDEPTPAARVAALRLPEPDGDAEAAVVDFLNRDLRADALSRQRDPARLLLHLRDAAGHADRPADRHPCAGISAPRRWRTLAYSGKGKSFFLTDLLRRS